MITCETSIGLAIIRKGMPAAEIMDEAFCDSERKCCPGVTVKIGHASQLKGKSKEEVQLILDQLNALEDVRK